MNRCQNICPCGTCAAVRARYAAEERAAQALANAEREPEPEPREAGHSPWDPTDEVELMPHERELQATPNYHEEAIWHRASNDR